jgi:hypothetical protein
MTKKHTPPVSPDRLLELIAAIDSASTLTADMRKDITNVLHDVHAIATRKHGRGRHTVGDYLAALVNVLVEQHGARVREALLAVLPDATDRLRDTIDQRYRDLKGSEYLADIEIDVESVERLAARLRNFERGGS